jgi:hypothetical protein
MSQESQLIAEHPEFQEDLFRPYGPGKFDDYAGAYVYELSLDGADEEVGDAGNDTYYALVNGPFEHRQLTKYKGAILHESDQGFVTMELYASKKKLDSTWKKVVEEVDALEESFEE